MDDSSYTLLQEAILGWLNTLSVERSFSPNTLLAYQNDIALFIGFMEKHLGGALRLEDLADLKARDFRGFLAARLQEGITPRSNARTLSAVRAFFTYIKDHYKISNTTIHTLNLPRISKSLPRPLQENEAVELLDACQQADQSPWVIARNRALFSLLYGAGLRISEALALQVQDVLNKKLLKIRGKRRKERLVPLLPEVEAEICLYIKLCPYNLVTASSLFVGVRGGILLASAAAREMRLLRPSLGLPETASPHSLRHSFATHILAGGGELRAIQELLGHASLSTTQVYTKVDDQRLLETYQKLHPRQ